MQQPEPVMPVGVQAPPQQSQQWYLATVPRRFAAMFLDGLLFIPVYLIFAVVANITGYNQLIGLAYLLYISYIVFFIWKYGATLGKKWVNIRVVRGGGQPMGLGHAILRETVGKFLSNLVFDLGYFWALWDKNKQTWHDKIAGTYVVTPIPNNGKTPIWLYIVLGLLLLLPLLVILAVIVLVAINPLGILKQSKDTRRQADLTEVRSAIEQAQASNPKLQLCGNARASYCEGRSDDGGANAIDGSGWVKIDFSKTNVLTALPIDPTNMSPYVYRYCSDGKNWELNALFESPRSAQAAANDSGDDPMAYELGTKLTVCRMP